MRSRHVKQFIYRALGKRVFIYVADKSIKQSLRTCIHTLHVLVNSLGTLDRHYVLKNFITGLDLRYPGRSLSLRAIICFDTLKIRLSKFNKLVMM